ncbi:MAG TPA: amidohydrolase family protein [Arenimonas sp.]|nr:amidohydrolase family protein [Arenimonas sp.]
MDSHVHVSAAPGLPETADAEIEALRAAFVLQQPRSYLYHGVTQLLDPANFPAPLAAFNAQPQRPDLFHCGAVPLLNGYPSVFLPAEHRHQQMPNFLHEPANPDRLPALARAEQHTPEAVVAAVKASGAHCLKLYIEDGFGDDSDWPLPRVETLREVTAAAHRQGLIVLAHANALDMQQLAIEAEVDVIAHGLWNWTGMDGAEGVPPAVAALNQRIHDQRIGLQATLRVMPGLAALFDPATLDDPAYAAVVPPALLAWYRTIDAQWFARELSGNLAPAQHPLLMQRQRRKADQALRALRDLYGRGHALLLASDTPAAPTYAHQPGYNTFQEMQLMAAAGVPLAEIFRAGTINNARQFGLDQDYGTIEVGKIANLILLDANPLADVSHWNRIDRVILHGVAIARQQLRANSAR